MQVCRGPQRPRSRRKIPVSTFHSIARELIPFHTERLAIQEEFDRVTIGVASHGNELPFLTLPIPVRKQMQHRLAGPLALIKVEAILFETAGIDNAGGRTFHGPHGFAQIVDARPHKIAGDVAVGSDELPELFYVDAPVRAKLEPGRKL